MAAPIQNMSDFQRRLARSKRLMEQRRKAEGRRWEPNLFGFLLFDERHEAARQFARTNFAWLDQLAKSSRMFVFVFLEEGQKAIPLSPGEFRAGPATGRSPRNPVPRLDFMSRPATGRTFRINDQPTPPGNVGPQEPLAGSFVFETDLGRWAIPDSDDDAPVFLVQGGQQIENPSLEVARLFGITPNRLPGVVLFTELSDNAKQTSDGVYLPLRAELFANDAKTVEEILADLFSIIQECRPESDSPKALLANLDKKLASLRSGQQDRPVIASLRQYVDVASLIAYTGSLLQIVVKGLMPGG
jgi:hypothetical protein